MRIFAWYEGPDGIRHKISDYMLYRDAGDGVVKSSNSIPQISAPASRFTATHKGTDLFIRGDGKRIIQKLELLSPSGRVVRSIKDIKQNATNIDCSEFGSGLYFVNINAGSQKFAVPVLIQQ